MNILAFDTSSSSGSIALSINGLIKYASYFDILITHSETLLPQVDLGLKTNNLTIKDIQALIITNGPGSFTGLRIGLATAKGICLANEIPLITYSTLQLLSSNCFGSKLPILSMIDAKMNEIYCALYSPELEEIISPMTIKPEDLVSLIKEPVVAVGSGYLKYGSELIRLGLNLTPALPHQHLPMATGLFSLLQLIPSDFIYNFDAIADLEPMYLRKSQAEVARDKRLNSTDII
jgi:tRNA threonylcarbamoyladenosine biosynthesis protein TsaB